MYFCDTTHVAVKKYCTNILNVKVFCYTPYNKIFIIKFRLLKFLWRYKKREIKMKTKDLNIESYLKIVMKHRPNK